LATGGRPTDDPPGPVAHLGGEALMFADVRRSTHEWRRANRRANGRWIKSFDRQSASMRKSLVEEKAQLALDATGNPIAITSTPNLSVSVEPWNDTTPDPPQPWESTCVGVQSTTLQADDQTAYDERMGLKSKKYLTMMRPSDAKWILDKVRDRITGKTVVEIGAGIGVLAVALAAHASRVYAIEADPMWSFVFSRYLYQAKPTNLTFILDRAENLVDVIKADVAICVTGSAEDQLRELCSRFAPEVIMPWQDWNGGKAVVRHWGRL
jgi:hypothetical protein